MSDYEKQLELRIEELESSLEKANDEICKLRSGEILGERVNLSLKVDNFELVGMTVREDNDIKKNLHYSRIYVILKITTKATWFSKARSEIVEVVWNSLSCNNQSVYRLDTLKELCKEDEKKIENILYKCEALGYLSIDVSSSKKYFRITDKWLNK